MLNIKVSLVTSTGILLASKPEVVDDTRQILATGLMTALISFSKEVHHRELQSISYHDRTVSFVRVHDFVLILETIDEDSTLTEKRLGQLLEQLKSCTEPILEGVDPDIITDGEAEIILDKCLQDIQLLHYSISEQPLHKAERAQFTLLHTDKGWEIKDKVGSGSFIPTIALMLDTLKANEKCKGALRGIITHLPEDNSTVYIIVDTDGQTSKIGILKTPRELDLVLFRLFTMMDQMLHILSEEESDHNMEEIINTLMDIDDPGNRISSINLEDLSPSFLERIVGRNLDKAIYSAVVGEPIFVIGDKPTVKLVIDTLSIFNQHMQTSVNPWISETEITQNGKCDLTARICGMSTKVYKILFDNETLTESDTSINLNSGKTTGLKSSSHFKKLYDTIKKLSISELVTKIALELENIVSLSLDLTSISLVDETKGRIKLKELSSKSGYSSSFVRKALEMTVKRNMLLDYLL
ncbi:MAG: hypothetical protein GOP50_03385 [Candidatus Heimdallarchaeota archaeon]|nr:hypothetical protein [Candidatus Heimdallarchaeota archaeon]